MVTLGMNRFAYASVILAILVLPACGGSGSDSAQPTVTPTVTPRPSLAPPPQSFAWMQPTKGRPAFLGDDGGNAVTGTVCDSPEHYRAWLAMNPSGGCNSYAHGTRVVIDQVTTDPAKDQVGDAIMPLVRIHSADSSWSGYTELQTLRPVIPSGLVVHFKREGNDTLRLASTQQTADGPDLGDEVTAKLVKYSPDTTGADLYVAILDGQYAGKEGWLYSLEAVDIDGTPLATFSQAVIAATPEPSVDPNTRTYVTHKDIRAFKDMSECDDAFNAMSNDDAYQRLKDAVAAGDYVDFPKGTRLHVVDDPEPDSVFLIAGDDSGNQGCVGRYELPGYGL